MKLYELHRKQDISGISGIGIVAEGVEFKNGKFVISWLGAANIPSIGVYDSLDHAIKIHGHNGATEFREIHVVINTIESAQLHKKITVKEDYDIGGRSVILECECGETFRIPETASMARFFDLESYVARFRDNHIKKEAK